MPVKLDKYPQQKELVAICGTALLVILLAACDAGNGEGLDENGRPLSEIGGDRPLAVTFQSIQANVFSPNCAISGCHLGSSAPLGLVLDARNSFDLLVGVPSGEQPELLRVSPHAPDNSYLIQKLEGASSISGLQMPRGRPPLPQSTIDFIRQWITDGALPPASSFENG